MKKAVANFQPVVAAEYDQRTTYGAAENALKYAANLILLVC